jgi:hypothetical protein
LTPTGPGQAVISFQLLGFTAPSSGAQLTVTVI